MPPEIKHPPCFDGSHWKAPITFATLSPLPWLMFTKVSEGDDPRYDDPYFLPWFHLMKLYGIRRGGFHFLRPGDIGNQAERFLRLIRQAPLAEDDIPVLDWEDKGNSLADAKQWLEHVHRETGIRPIIYTGAYIVEPLYDGKPVPSWFKDYLWWVSGYPDDPDPFTEIPMAYVPRGLTRANICAWQYSARGRWTGVTGNVDLNLLSPWWVASLGLSAPKGVDMNFVFSITPVFSNGCSVRPDHTTNNTKITGLPHGKFAFGMNGTPWEATASDAYHTKGDKWWQVTHLDGNPIMVDGQPVSAWIAEIHNGKKVSTVTLLSAPPPPEGGDELIIQQTFASPGYDPENVTVTLRKQ